MELFSSNNNLTHQPLAARMRPQTVDEFVGQDHILGQGRLLRRAIQADQLSSLIFYGPPGSGKTTLARVIANTTHSNFTTLNAVLSGVKDIREQINNARERWDLYTKRTILFVDEVHRWNKAQQDALLPWVENGTFILIGATTENPYFEVNSALVSRSRIFQLKKLEYRELLKIAHQALKNKERGYGNYQVEFEAGALEHLCVIADGDARSLLNALELAVETTPQRFPPPPDTAIHISLESAEESIQKKVVLYDKEGDYHFDTISAFIKSLRGSDPDAALYWMAKMISAGEDPKFIFRRMLIASSEDVGLADPQALMVVEAAAAAFDRVGLPEGQFHLAQAALYLATAPKSNSALGYFDALEALKQEHSQEVPNPLKDASRDKESFGHGKDYLYPHAYKNHWIAQQYLPEGMAGRIFYNPSTQGYEKSIRDEVLRKREAQLEASLPAATPEVLTFSPENRVKERWLKRLTDHQQDHNQEIRGRVFARLTIQRYHRILDLNPGSGLLLWEALRLVPEGGVWALVEKEEQYQLLHHYAGQFRAEEQPILIRSRFSDLEPGKLGKDLRFEQIIGRNGLTAETDKKTVFRKIFSLLAEHGRFSLAEIIPSRSTRLSQLFTADELPRKILDRYREAEAQLYGDPADPRLNWGEEDLVRFSREAGFRDIGWELVTYQKPQTIRGQDLDNWLNLTNPQSYGSKLKADLGETTWKQISNLVYKKLPDQEVSWTSTILFLWGQA